MSGDDEGRTCGPLSDLIGAVVLAGFVASVALVAAVGVWAVVVWG